MAIVSFVMALAIYALTFYLFHYLGPDCSLGTVYHKEAAKPFVTLCCGIWGVMHHFAAVTSLLIGCIFFPKETNK